VISIVDVSALKSDNRGCGLGLAASSIETALWHPTASPWSGVGQNLQCLRLASVSWVSALASVSCLNVCCYACRQTFLTVCCLRIKMLSV